MVGTVLTGSAVLCAFAEGFAAAVTIYGICKGADGKTGSRRNSGSCRSSRTAERNQGGRKA